MSGPRHSSSSKTTFDDFFSAFSKSVRVDVQLENGEIVVSQSGNLLNEALAATATATAMAEGSGTGSTSRPSTRSSTTAKATTPLLPRLQHPKSPLFEKATPGTGISRSDATVVSLDVPLPTYLSALTALQASDGSWQFDDKFRFVIHDVATPPPEGISSKLWATAVVLTIFRQFPEYYAQLEPAYDKAMLHVDDNVLRVAKSHVDLTPTAIEQIRPYQNNEAKRIREQLAREAAARRAEEDAEERRAEQEREKIVAISKLSLTKARRLPLATQEFLVATLRCEVHTVFPRTDTHKTVPVHMRPQEMEIRVGDTVECCWRRVDGSKRPQVHGQWWRCVVTAISGDGTSVSVQYEDDPFARERNVRFKYVRLTMEDARDRRGLALGNLAQKWEEPVPLRDELLRLQEVDERRKWRKPWEVRSLPSLPTVQNVPQDRDRAHPARSGGVASVSVPVSPRRRLTVAALDALHDRQQQDLNKDFVLEDLYQQAVSAVLVYDKLYTQLHHEVKRATKAYACAVLFGERFHAFDAFVESAVQLVASTVHALERIDAWAHYESPHMTPSAGLRMFVWDGQDFVLKLLRSLDFLGARKQVAEWYGDDFPFSMNPFLMAESIRDHAHDRKFQFTATMQPLEPENALRTALRMHEKGSGDKEAVADAIPTWWPQARYDAVLRERIQKSEEFVIRYLQATDVLC